MVIVLAVALALFGALAALTLHLIRSEMRRASGTGVTSAVVIWLVSLFHADTVVAAAVGDVATLSLPAKPMLAAGASLAVLGFVVFLAATVTLVRHGDFEGIRSMRTVVAGPYRFSRHPQNLGWALMLLGLAVASQSVAALVLVAAFAVFAIKLTRLEEVELSRRLGPTYASYREVTPRFLRLPALRSRYAARRARAS